MPRQISLTCNVPHCPSSSSSVAVRFSVSTVFILPYANEFALSPDITSMQLNVICGTIISSRNIALSASTIVLPFLSIQMAAPLPPTRPVTNLPTLKPLRKVMISLAISSLSLRRKYLERSSIFAPPDMATTLSLLVLM